MPGQAIVTLNENQWEVSVASTYAELTTGLRGIASLAANTGMLFILPAAQAVLVDTTGMNFALDIVFIANNIVIDVARNIEPGYLVTEETPCDSFLEVNAGEADDIESGDAVIINNYQPATTTLTSWIAPIVSFVGLMAVGAFMVSTVRGITRSILGESKGRERLKLLPQAKEGYYLGGWKPGDIALYTDFGLKSLYVVQIMEWPEKLDERFGTLIEEPYYLPPVIHDRQAGSVRAKIIDTTLAEWDFPWYDQPLPEWHRVGSIHYYHYTNLYRNVLDLIRHEEKTTYPEVQTRIVTDLMNHPGWEMLKRYGLVKPTAVPEEFYAETQPMRRLRYFIINRKTGRVAYLLYQKGDEWELFSFKTRDYTSLGKLSIGQIAPKLTKMGISGEEYHITSEPPIEKPLLPQTVIHEEVTEYRGYKIKRVSYKEGTTDWWVTNPIGKLVGVYFSEAEAKSAVDEDIKPHSRAVIPVEPRRRKETDLEYLADSPEFLAQTIADIGYRDKLDTAFQEAIARAKGLR